MSWKHPLREGVADSIAIEAAWSEPGACSDGKVIEQLTAAHGRALTCDARSASMVDDAIAGLFEDWVSDHRATIDRYKGLLRLG